MKDRCFQLPIDDANRKSSGLDSAIMSQDRRRLPPLGALRAFEAAARHAGFQAAGRELGLSANAVAWQIRILEDWLGLALFRRLPRGVAVTDAGRSYAGAIGDQLDRLAGLTAELLQRENSHVLTIGAMPSFAARWLIPRLGSLQQAHPGLDIRVVAAVALTDFAREEVDVVVRLGEGTYPGMRSDPLLWEEHFPVCSPTLLAAKTMAVPTDLAAHVLLHEETIPRIPRQVSWASWLATLSVGGVNATRGLRFSYSHMALQAAAAGQGVALASSALIGDDLVTGRLVRPFGPLALRGPYGFHVVCPADVADRPKVSLFRDWMLTEAAATNELVDRV
jgi:LysR family glycine cleavage system transcriptional activator